VIHASESAKRPAVFGIVLAAGRATRFGAPKLLASLAGRPLIRVTVEHLLATPLDRVIVITGAHADEVAGALADLNVDCLFNQRFAEGMGTSLAAGIAAVRHDAAAALVALGDQPLADAAIVGRLLAARAPATHLAVRPSYAGVPGHPVLFEAATFPRLARLRGDGGARTLLEAWRGRVAHVACEYGAPIDIDTPADLAALERITAASSSVSGRQ
jgi:molybdenum cofactor cytidylyltransferase